MISASAVCRLLRCSPKEEGELPDGLVCLLPYEESLFQAQQLREAIDPEEWFFCVKVAMHKLKVPFVVREGCEDATNGKLIVLKHEPYTSLYIFRAAHEIAHWWLCKKGFRHADGDAHLVAAMLVFPSEYFDNASRARMLAALCDMMPREFLIAWAQAWVPVEDLGRYLPESFQQDPSLFRLLQKYRSGVDGDAVDEGPTLLKIVPRRVRMEEPDASALLPEMCSTDFDEPHLEASGDLPSRRGR